MRLAFAFSTLAVMALLMAAPASAAPVALAGHGALEEALLHQSANEGSLVEPVAKRRRVRKTRRTRAKRCGWQCKPYWRPYQYRYWQFYYPHGGPLF